MRGGVAIALLSCAVVVGCSKPQPLAATGTFITTDFRTVTNKTTGQRSVALCGPGGTGMFINSTDNGGTSCIDEHGPVQQGELVWIHMNSSIYVETTCATQAHDNCGLLPGNTTGQCDVALPFQAFRASDLGYMGEADTMGGTLRQPKVNDFICPTPRPTPVTSQSPTAVPPVRTSTPPPLPSVTAAVPTATPFYVCVTATPKDRLK
jgi:hypothetical protein